MKLKLTTLMTSLAMANMAFAATPINLHHQPAAYLQHAMLLQATSAAAAKIEKISSNQDVNQTTHTRIQQTYAGIPVWDATGVIHTPKAAIQNNHSLSASINNKSTMNGIVYEGLAQDLTMSPSDALTDAKKAAALQTAKTAYEKQTQRSGLQYTKESADPTIFVDDNKQAHYAYLVSFYLDDGKTGAHRPAFIIDALTAKIYRQWDKVMTEDAVPVTAGGIGGNEKMGERIYDGAEGHLSAATIQGEDQFCVFNTHDIVVQDVSYDNQTVYSSCIITPNQHNSVAWLSLDKGDTRWSADEINGGYSPTLDVFYNATIVEKLYQDWYHIPVLVEKDQKTPMKLVLRVHYGRRYENAFWDGEQMTFGDGGDMFYPLTTLDVTAHEISHGFTEQHSNIDASYPAMGGLHESFSDMASAAAEFYTTGKNSWSLGSDITKTGGAFRFMNDPTKDGRSIDNAADFTQDMDPHLVAGVYSKAFYLLATTKGWNTHKAFDVMVGANMHYWTSSMRLFQEAACGVIYATQDLATSDPSYDVKDVIAAFKNVGVRTNDC